MQQIQTILTKDQPHQEKILIFGSLPLSNNAHTQRYHTGTGTVLTVSPLNNNKSQISTPQIWKY